MSPTYRNDGDVCYVVQGIDDVKKQVLPGHSVETYDRNVPDDFVLVNSVPTLERNIGDYYEEDPTNPFSGSIRPKGHFSVSVSGEFNGTVSLIRSFDNFTTYQVFQAFQNSYEDTFEDYDPNAEYKLGICPGDWTSGEVHIILSK